MFKVRISSGPMIKINGAFDLLTFLEWDLNDNRIRIYFLISWVSPRIKDKTLLLGHVPSTRHKAPSVPGFPHQQWSWVTSHCWPKALSQQAQPGLIVSTVATRHPAQTLIGSPHQIQPKQQNLDFDAITDKLPIHWFVHSSAIIHF